MSMTEFELWNRGGWPRVDVVGEKFHQDEIKRVFAEGLSPGSNEFVGSASLVPEPHNPHDRNAISVRIAGHVVGYLPKELAARYVDVISGLVSQGRVSVTPCQIWAYEYEDWQGTDRRGRDVYRTVLDARASVVLDEPHMLVPANLPPISAHRVLPHGAALQVKGEEKHLDVLAPLVSGHGEAWVFATLHVVNVPSGRSEKRIVELRIDGQTIGELTPAMSAQYTATIDHVENTNELVVAKTLLKGNPIQVEAVLYAARSHQLDAAWLGTSPAESDATNEDPVRGLAAVGPVVVPSKPTSIVFQAPPGWPPAPDGWEPFEGWAPDPAWPAPPSGWKFWGMR